ncbi:MAG: polysaccharide deacetylase family protein [Candidatus Kapabacteria bacterium]|nr:polysaccharide deacetylase family protein [Candidatus Kapabacteria bacterium]
MAHKISVDLEEWFHPFHYRDIIPTKDWNKDISRIEYQTQLLLNLFKNHKTKATFFIVGWIAENFPDLVETIASDGHQIGIHSYYHLPVNLSDETTFELDTNSCINKIFEILREYPLFYRAPNFSINDKTKWCVKILSRAGIKYDSSMHKPTFHPDYGSQSKFPIHEFEIYGIKEYQIPTLEFGQLYIPFSGGAYFRYYPYRLTKSIIYSFEEKNEEIIFYIHPWEFDTHLPKINISNTILFRHRYNIKNNLSKLDNLLNDFKFEPINL